MEGQHPTHVSWLNVLKWNGSGTGVFVVPKSDTISFSRGKKMKYWQMSDLTRRNIETVAAEFTV